MVKQLAFLAVIAAVSGCSSAPSKPVTAAVDMSNCRPVEGAPFKQNWKGQKAYKYICGEQAVWIVPKY